MKKKSFEQVLTEKEQYDPETQAVLVNLSKTRDNLDELKSMKRTQGWKILEASIREELHARIVDLVKDDGVVKTLLDFLNASDTKKLSKVLTNEIEKILPEEGD